MVTAARRGRLGALALAVAVLPLGVAAGQQDRHSGSDRLTLKERRIEMSILENLAIVRYALKVSNPTDRQMEGRVTFDVPSGGTGCELSLLRNVASTDRFAKVMEPRRAAALYDAARRRDRKLDELIDPDARLIGVGPGLKPREKSEGGKAEDETVAGTERTQKELVGSSGSDGGSGTSSAKAEGQPPAPPPPPPPPVGGDPALLEHVSGDTYRLRFFPVPAYGEETVTAVFAMEIRRKSDDCVISVPLPMDHNFSRDAKAVETLLLSVTSDKPLGAMASATHGLPAVWPFPNTRQAAVKIDGKAREFALTYSLDPAAPLFDFRKEIDWSIVTPREGKEELSVEGAVQAVMARKAVDELSGIVGAETTAKLRDISMRSMISTRHASLIVIERSEIAQVEDSKEFREAILKGADGCDYVRKAAGLSHGRHAASCQAVVEKTSDPARVKWAQEQGLKTWASVEMPGFTCIQFIRHRAACEVTETDPAKLLQAAKQLKK